MPVSKVIGSALQLSQELTLAVGNLNFNFSLVKVEAPPEYAGLCSVLSFKRKNEAENGDSHATARKLAALFQKVLPETPNLVSAYGNRVSEFSKSKEYNPAGTVADGLFRDHIGADATTIWAAATSGKGAIAVHLLACRLARMWEQVDAISIWVEIVETRKAKLKQYIEQSRIVNAETAFTTSITVSRDPLADWDRGAR